MEHSRKQKLLMIIALVAGIVSLSVGFAAFSVTLNVSSSASVTPSSDTFSVKFSTEKDSLVVGAVTPSSKTAGITTTDGVINNGVNPTIKGLSATFTEPGQFVEYTFYARNEGEYTAYLNNINFLGGKICTGETGTTASLVNSACESIMISVTVGNITYTEKTPIEGHTLSSGVGESIKIRLEYMSNGTAVDGAFSIVFPDIALVYSTVNNSEINPKVARIISGDLYTVGSLVAIGSEQFYLIEADNDNVKLFAVMNVDVDGTPIQRLDAGYTVFSSDSHKGETYTDYKGSIVEEYVNSYKYYLEVLGVDIIEARLINYEEYSNPETFACEYGWSCSTQYPFIYSTEYWTAEKFDDTSMISSSLDGIFGDNGYDCEFGVRPVIVMSKSEF